MAKLAKPLAFLLALALAACSSVQVSQDYDPGTDFGRFRTFDWFPGGRQLTGDVEIDSPLIDQRVRAAVGRELTLRGFQKVEDRSPDFYVNYHVSSKTKLSSSGINTYYGVGSYGSWGGVGIGMGSNPVRQYEQGTLVIDFVDATSRKLVWRGSGTQALRANPTPEQTTETIDRAVAEILAQFPPGTR